MQPFREPGPGRAGILATATREFARDGIRGTSLRQIADAAGVTKAAVYHHFRTKDDIVRAILEPALTDLTLIVRRAREHTGITGQVESAVIALADQAVRHRRTWSILLQDPAAAQLLTADPAGAATMAALQDVLSGPRPDDARRLAVSMFLCGLIGPALDAGLSDIDEDRIRRGIIAAGLRLLAS